MTPPSRAGLAAMLASLVQSAQPSRRNGPSSATSSAVRDDWDETTPVGEQADELLSTDAVACPVPTPAEIYDDDTEETAYGDDY